MKNLRTLAMSLIALTIACSNFNAMANTDTDLYEQSKKVQEASYQKALAKKRADRLARQATKPETADDVSTKEKRGRSRSKSGEKRRSSSKSTRHVDPAA